jgi:heterodisulfide reductase subunit A
VSTPVFDPLQSSRRGVFVCGTASGPKDIPESVIQASGASSAALALLGDFESKRLEVERPQPIDLRGEPTRIGTFVCRCGINIASTVDVPSVVQYASTLPKVVHAQEFLFACAKDSQKSIAEAIKEKRLTRVVVAACTPRTHEPLFQRLASQAGINPYLVELVNLREQCAWVHQGDPAGATRKAAEMVRMGVARVQVARPLRRLEREPARTALVIGGGVSGMTAALAIADAGYDVQLVERKGELGGNLHHVYYVAEGENPQRLLRDLVNRVVGHARIQLHLRTQVVAHSGSVGDFRAVLRTATDRGPAREHEIRHAVTVVATGGEETRSPRYLLGQDPRVIPQSELEEILAHQVERAGRLRSVAMIQCVQPEGAVEYCSRICCTNTIKNALRLKMLNPECQVVVFYKNIITYGFREQYYLEARRRGVLFVRYTDREPPQVRLEARGARQALVVSAREHVFGTTLTFEPDLLALSMSIEPSAGSRALAEMISVPLSPDGFFMEAHLKMRPMDFADDGLFLAGMAHYPKFIEECITHALACAGRALTILSRPSIQLGGVVAQVDAEKCTGCLTCVRTCPFSIPQIRPDIPGVGGLGGSAWIDPARCQGCGTCTGECPARAIQLENYRDEQILAGLGPWGAPVAAVADR